jgi:hypothetical protein
MKMKYSWMVYLLLLVVIIVSFVATWRLPVSNIFKGIASVPGSGALLMAIYQIWRDRVSYERQKELQREQLSFNLSVTSHMANVAFDKHVEFCEKYVGKMSEGLHKLFVEGPTDYALSLAGELSEIRRGFRTWLTEDITTKILAYENALREIGASDRLLNALPVSEKRNKVVDKMFDTFSKVTGIKDTEGNIDENIAPERIITHLQQVLGINEFTKLRQKVIAEAMGSSSRKTL